MRAIVDNRCVGLLHPTLHIRITNSPYKRRAKEIGEKKFYYCTMRCPPGPGPRAAVPACPLSPLTLSMTFLSWLLVVQHTRVAVAEALTLTRI